MIDKAERMSRYYANHLDVTKSWHEMLEAEESGMPTRLHDLERTVRDQQDEIAFLKSTVADLQRRLNMVEGSRATVTKGTSALASAQRNTPLRYTNGLHGGYDRSDGPRRRIANNLSNNRRPHHHQSTGSLHSDGHSSHSVSPVTSPSPTCAQPQQQRHPTATAANRTVNLTKRWSSTSDFQPARQSPAPAAGSPAPSPAASLRRRPAGAARAKRPESFAGYVAPATLAEEPRDIWRLNWEATPTPSPRRPLSGSLSNLNRSNTLRAGAGGKDAVSYNAEDGVLKVYIRGRPVNLYAPSDVTEEYDVTAVLPPPQNKLKLEWTYGYRGKDCRNNLYLLPTGEMVYFVSAVVVLYNAEDQMQRHYLGHTGELKCLAVHPNRFTIASGQCAGNKPDAEPQVRIWDSVSLNTLHVLGRGFLERGVACLAFSQTDGGALLACVDEGHERTLSVWEWHWDAKVTENKAALETVLDVQWHPLDRGVLITCGRQHVNFWLLDAGTLMRRQGVFTGRDRPKYVTCMSFTDTGDLITGDSDGRILVWQRGGNQVARIINNAHSGTVFTLFVDKAGDIVSGGKDGRVIQWDRDFNQTGNVLTLPDTCGAPRVVSQGRGLRLLIGTTRNCILTGDWTLLPRPVVRGHTDQVWTAAAHPGRPQFATAGWDGLLFMWDLMTHSPVWELSLGEAIQCLCFSADGAQLLVGFASGRWDVLNVDTREILFSRVDGNEPIQVARFSPNGRMVALGSRNNTVYIYEAADNGFARVAKCSGHSSQVTQLDWSSDSAHLRTSSADLELLVWTATTGRQLTQPSQTRNIAWATHTCPLTFNSAAVYCDGVDGTDVTSCDRSHRGHLLASGDDWGRVKLYTYPANQAKANYHTYGGHSSHVSHVEFFSNDDRLVSTGGRDTAVLQWSVE